jgi:hypothetical protein
MKSFSQADEDTLKRTDGLMIYEQSDERFLSEALSVEVQLTGALPD